MTQSRAAVVRPLRRWQVMVPVLLAATVTGCSARAEQPEDAGAGPDCCSCRIAETETFSASVALPCEFDLPVGWDQRVGDDGAMVSALAGAPSCPEPCPGTSAITFSVATRPNRNADTMEEAWTGIMDVVGTARCGGREVRFFQTPGSEPEGFLGGLRFHVGSGGESYSATATFGCGRAGEWQQLRQLFIDTFRTNEGTTFGQG